MAANTSKKRATKFVPRSERAAWQRPVHTKAGADRMLDNAAKELSSPVNRVLSRQTGTKVTGGAHLVSSHKPAAVTDRGIVAFRRGALIGAGAAATLGGGAYLVHRSRQRSKAVSKNLINPFEEVVVFGKAYPVVWPAQGSTRVAALVPTGKNVGTANNLGHWKGRATGGPATKLERYTTKPRGQRQGPFGKAAAPSVQNGLKLIAGAPKATLPSGRGAATVPSARIKPRPSVQNGLRMVRDMKVNSNMPDGARAGGRLG